MPVKHKVRKVHKVHKHKPRHMIAGTPEAKAKMAKLRAMRR